MAEELARKELLLRELVVTIANRTGLLLELVNYNVEGTQYVAAGENMALATLTNVLNYIKVQKINMKKLQAELTEEQLRGKLLDIVDESLATAQAKAKEDGFVKLERGFATIPLPGIDVPFHSKYLWSGVQPFLKYLSKKVSALDLNPELLVGLYIPNLIADPFQVSKEYAQKIFDQTGSPRMEKLIRTTDDEAWNAPENRQKLAYHILCELLAYQFASPVRWIETQDLLFDYYQFERMIEVGPSPTLTGMASRTLGLKFATSDGALSRQRAILAHSKNQKEVYYQFEDAEPEAPAASAAAPAASSSGSAPAPAAAAAAPAAPAPSSGGGPVAEIPDAPLKAVDTVRVIIAQKLKKTVAEVPLTKTIKDLVGGKSTLQNELLSDLQLEFGSAPEKGEELPLDELGAAIQFGYSGAVGKCTSALISRMIGGKMPGGFNLSSAKAHLAKTWGLGPSRTDAALMLGVTLEPAKRLGSEAEAKAWLDTVAAAYAVQAGITLSSGGSGGGGGGGGGGGPVMNSEEFDKYKAEQEAFAAQHVELYMRHLGKDPREGQQAADVEKENVAELQGKLDAIDREHGDAYIQGIQPIFEPLKARHFDSCWNWVRQDALIMFFDIIFGRLTTVDREITARCIAIMNRADPTLIEYMQYHVDQCVPEDGDNFRLAKEFGQQLLDNCREALHEGPVYKDVTFPTAPHTEVSAKGDIVYSEVVRTNVRKLEAYVAEMAQGGKISPSQNVNLEKVQSDVAKLYKLVKAQPQISRGNKAAIKSLYGEVVKNLARTETRPSRTGTSRVRRSSSQFMRPAIPEAVAAPTTDKLPLLHLKRKVGTTWQYSSKLTSVYLDVLTEIATSGTTFKGKNALLTGVGKGSIGCEILKGLLAGGATVVVTTSRYNRKTVEYYQNIYQEFGSRGSALTVVPFNQGSKQDVDGLVDYIYSTLGLDLDYILPFAAIPENGREIDGLDDKSELAHRVMLTNLLRILGAVKQKKAARHFVTRPTQVVLPLSPNHGLFGNDGLYSESKISLETLFQRWGSESWGEYLCLAGAVIGWTRGTGLMSATNTVAEGLEKLGVRTFSAKEMAFNILGLMHPLLFDITQIEPVWADLNGGMDRLPDLAEVTTKIRTNLQLSGDLRRAVAIDNSADFKIINGVDAERIHQKVPIALRANFKFDFPSLESVESLEKLNDLQGMIDLDKVMVITGFAEVGPWGSSRTRWEMEAKGEFTIEGLIEMSWIMGYIKHFDGRLKSGKAYVGWVDSKTEEPVDDKDVRAKYEKEILDHAGIRLIEPELFHGYDPKKKAFHQEVQLNHDLEPIEVSAADADQFKREQGDKCDVWAQPTGEFFVKFKRGARILVPKAVKFTRLVAGQLPTGWNARRYGLPDEIIAQTDRTALWALVATMEALVMSGFHDPYELYKYVHPSEVGTAIGSGMGGMRSLSAMFKDRKEEKDIQKDILQETFINTVAGWINLLLMSASGPVKIPVGACATALQSVEIACDSIMSGKAKVMLAGGFDDFSEEGSYEFANMKATSNTETEFAMGREPTEFSRPTTSTRDGFMEAQGAGVQVIMSARTALEMGAPIQGIVAYTSTHTDKAGRSIPAPGRGVLSVARQIPSANPLPLLDIKYRTRQLAFRRKQIGEWLQNEHDLLKAELEAGGSSEDIQDKISEIEIEAGRQEKAALGQYGMLEGSDPRVAPLRRALAVWNLDIDDVNVVSMHGTSTKANDKNETGVYQDIFKHLGRTKGNAVPVIAQKSLTGHPKGGAAAWQLNGLLQSLQSALIPPNWNADNIAAELKKNTHLFFPSKPIQHVVLQAGMITSFGFGQVGGDCLILHPRHLYACLDPAYYASYVARRAPRAKTSYSYNSEALVSNSLIRIKEHPPYDAEHELGVLLNPIGRTSIDKAGEYSFASKLPQKMPKFADHEAVRLALTNPQVAGVGIDTELISEVPSNNHAFVSRNYTSAEIAYCQKQPSPQASFAGRWAAKEAVFKALAVESKGAAAAMKEIEITTTATGPEVSFHGELKALVGSKTIKLSISHDSVSACAYAVASA